MSIYSDEIPKICSFCTFSDKSGDDFVYCRKKMKNMDITAEACRYYKYNILKRTVRRKKQFNVNLDPKDFEI